MKYSTSGQTEYASCDTAFGRPAAPPSCAPKACSRLSMGREGLVARVSGTRARNATITVQEMAKTFSLHGNFRTRTTPSNKPKNSICGLVMQAAAKASQAPTTKRLSAKRIANRTKNRLITWVWPQIDMLYQTAGLNTHRA